MTTTGTKTLEDRVRELERSVFRLTVSSTIGGLCFLATTAIICAMIR